jgi:protein gp37
VTKFKTIVIDPPWPGPGQARSMKGGEAQVIPYQTMTGIQIAALRIRDLTDKGGFMELSKVLEKELLEGRFWTHSKTLVEGCTKVSPGCLNCWSESMQMRFNGGKNFDGTITEHPDRLFDILPKSRNRAPRVCTYWNDIFHRDVTYALRDGLFQKIEVSQDFHIICTKRPANAATYLSGIGGTPKFRPMDNAIILVTMENQQAFDARIDDVIEISANGWNVGGLFEPLLEPFDLTPGALNHLKWIICGPENGKGKRPFDGQWAMRLQAQAKEAGVPFFYKAGLLNGKRYIETP